MAIWHFKVEFAPRENLLNYFGEIPAMIDEDIYWAEDLTEGVKLPDDYEVFLSRLGVMKKLERTAAAYCWGDNETNRISIDFQNKNKISVDARFHVGELDKKFVEIVLAFAKICDCVLISLNRTVFEPELNLFIEELKRSNSYKFCKDPAGFLQSDEVIQLNENIRKKLIDDELNSDY